MSDKITRRLESQEVLGPPLYPIGAVKRRSCPSGRFVLTRLRISDSSPRRLLPALAPSGSGDGDARATSATELSARTSSWCVRGAVGLAFYPPLRTGTVRPPVRMRGTARSLGVLWSNFFPRVRFVVSRSKSSKVYK
jgi:hypothetical protein